MRISSSVTCVVSSVVRSSLSLLALVACGACNSAPNAQLFGDGTGTSTGSGGEQSAGNGGSAAQGTGGAPAAGNPGTSSGGEFPTPAGGAPSGGASPTGGRGSGGTASPGGSGSGGDAPQSGGRSSGGVNAAGADAGMGGSVQDAGADTGVTPPIDSGSGTGGAPPVRGKVLCGDKACDLGMGEVCCVKETAMMGGGTRTTIGCAKDGSMCTRVFRCDSDADCGGGQHCCMEFNMVSNTPSTSCVAHECAMPYACTVPADCPNGTECCGVIGQGPIAGIRYTSVTCEASCIGTVFCVNDDPCDRNTSCQQSQTLPTGYLVCR
jgi:hypothetical protein